MLQRCQNDSTVCLPGPCFSLDLVSGSCNSCYLLWFGLVVPKRVYVVAVKRLQVPPGETPGRPAISCFFCPPRPFSHIRSFVCFCIGQQSLMYDRMILRRRGRHTTPDPRALFFCPCHVPRCDHRGRSHEVLSFGLPHDCGSHMTKSGRAALGQFLLLLLAD